MIQSPPRATTFVAFEHANYRLFVSSRFITITASEMQSVAVAWQVYNLTHRPLDLGLVGLAQFLPGILLFLAAGHAADRFSRIRILRNGAALFALCSLLLFTFAMQEVRNVYLIYLVLLLNGVVRAFTWPAGQAVLPSLVPDEHFANAVTWNSSAFQGAAILGPILGGLLYGIIGRANEVYACCAAGYIIGFFCLRRIRPRVIPRKQGAPSVNTVLNGLRYIWHNKLILGSVSLDLFAVLLGGAVALLPVYARDILRVDALGLGLLRSAPGAGALLVAFAMAHRPLRRSAGAVMLWCVAAFGFFTIVFGVSRNILASLVALVMIGASDMVSVVVRNVVTQMAVPDEMRGRVSAVNMIFIGASNEVGEFESGVTAQWLGTVPAVVLGGVGTILVVALWARFFPELRKIDALPSSPLK